MFRCAAWSLLLGALVTVISPMVFAWLGEPLRGSVWATDAVPWTSGGTPVTAQTLAVRANAFSVQRRWFNGQVDTDERVFYYGSGNRVVPVQMGYDGAVISPVLPARAGDVPRFSEAGLLPHVRQRWGSIDLTARAMNARPAKAGYGQGYGTIAGSDGTESAFGWPMLSFACGRASPEEACRIGRGIELPAWLRGTSRFDNDPNASSPLWAGSEVVLPTTPLWFGIAVNIAFYSVLAFSAMGVQRVWCDWVRYARGRCPQCRYDLRHDFSTGCPECGWRKPASHGA